MISSALPHLEGAAGGGKQKKGRNTESFGGREQSGSLQPVS